MASTPSTPPRGSGTPSGAPPGEEPSPGRSEEEPSGRERVGYLLRHSKLWIGALVLLALAVAVAAGSLAVFTSSSANPGNTASAGILSQDNSKDGAAILTTPKMVPGETSEGTVTIENTGDVAGTFSVSQSNLTNFKADGAVASGADAQFSEVLNLTIEDDTTGAVVYDGPIDGMPATPIDGTGGAGSAWEAGESHDFTFAVEFESTGDAADNTYQGTKTTVDFNWSAVSADGSAT